MTEAEIAELDRIARRAKTSAKVIQGIPIFFQVWTTLFDIETEINALILRSKNVSS